MKPLIATLSVLCAFGFVFIAHAQMPYSNSGVPSQNGFSGMMGGYGVPFGYLPFEASATGYGDSWWSELITIIFSAFALIGIVATIRWLLARKRKG